MAIFVTSKYEEDPIKIEGARVATTQNNDFSRCSRAANTPQSEVEPSRNSNSSEMLWLPLLFPRMKIQSKMKLLEWPQHFPHYNSMGAICCHGNQSSDQTWPKT